MEKLLFVCILLYTYQLVTIEKSLAFLIGLFQPVQINFVPSPIEHFKVMFLLTFIIMLAAHAAFSSVLIFLPLLVIYIYAMNHIRKYSLAESAYTLEQLQSIFYYSLHISLTLSIVYLTYILIH